MKAGDIVRVENSNITTLVNGISNPRENKEFNGVWVQDEDGTEWCALITDAEMSRIRIRSMKNREDWPRKSLIGDLLD
jgi:hypothetical protein